MLLGALISILLITQNSNAGDLPRSIDWANPPVACVEDIPHFFDDEIKNARQIVRRHNVSREEYLKAYDIVDAFHSMEQKIEQIYKAANERLMPPQFLLAIIMIENLLANDGISYDGGNYSCGLTQINVAEWCRWAQTLKPSDAKKIGWPGQGIQNIKNLQPEIDFCGEVLRSQNVGLLMEPVIKGHPAEEMNRVDPRAAGKTSFSAISSKLEGSDQSRFTQYRALVSFLNHCREIKYSIPALAEDLFEIHEGSIPDELKRSEHYSPGQKPQTSCRRKIRADVYPIKTSWLLTGAIFNAGEEIVEGIDKYKPKAWSEMRPDDLMRTVAFVPTTGEYFGKNPIDWKVLDFYVRSIINYEAKLDEPLVPAVPYPQLSNDQLFKR